MDGTCAESSLGDFFLTLTASRYIRYVWFIIHIIMDSLLTFLFSCILKRFRVQMKPECRMLPLVTFYIPLVVMVYLGLYVLFWNSFLSDYCCS